MQGMASRTLQTGAPAALSTREIEIPGERKHVPEQLPLAPGWKEVLDEKNKLSYFNEQTGKTSLSRPVTPVSVGDGTGSRAMQSMLTLYVRAMTAHLAIEERNKPTFTPGAYVEKFGPHIKSDNIRTFNLTDTKVYLCRARLHAHIRKHCPVKTSLQVFGGPGAGKSFLMANLPAMVDKAADSACLTDDNAHHEQVVKALEAGLPTRVYWVTAPFSQTTERVAAREFGYELEYQTDEHNKTLADFKDLCERFGDNPNFEAIAIINPSVPDQVDPFASLKIFEGKEALALASRWKPGEQEEF
jgi:hypothetical protein